MGVDERGCQGWPERKRQEPEWRRCEQLRQDTRMTGREFSFLRHRKLLNGPNEDDEQRQTQKLDLGR